MCSRIGTGSPGRIEYKKYRFYDYFKKKILSLYHCDGKSISTVVWFLDKECLVKKKITANEVEIVGGVVIKGKRIKDDPVSKRIEYLLDHYLKKICAEPVSGWSLLYIDPNDERFWELWYPHGEIHGGGPPALKCIRREDAVLKYGQIAIASLVNMEKA